MLNYIVAAELRIFIGDRVKAMRTSGDDGFGFDFIQCADIFFGHLDE